MFAGHFSGSVMQLARHHNNIAGRALLGQFQP